MLLVLDALGEQHRAAGLGVVVDGVHDLGDGRARALLDQAQVELDDVRAQQRHEGQRHRVGADVVERHAPADVAHPLDGAQQLGRAQRQRPLGDLHDDAQLAGGRLRDREQVVQRGGVEHLRLDVDEQRQRREQPLLDGAVERRRPARLVELGQAPGLAGRGEQRVRALERALRPAGQRLVRHDRAGVQVDDRLEHAAHRSEREVHGVCLATGRVREGRRPLQDRPQRADLYWRPRQEALPFRGPSGRCRSRKGSGP